MSAVTLQAVGSAPKYSTLDYQPAVYANCGCWQNGSTDFLLVNRGDIVLGSWVPPVGFSTETGDSAQDNHIAIFLQLKELNPTLHEFFLGARGMKRAYIRSAWLCPHRKFRLTADADTYCFIGDCHIHLYKEWFCDNFIIDKYTWKGPIFDSNKTSSAYTKDRVSLEAEFASFINFARPRVTKLVQIGDLYEYWEVQAIYEAAFEVLENAIRLRAYADATNYGFLTGVHSFPGCLLTDPERFQTALDAETLAIDKARCSVPFANWSTVDPGIHFWVRFNHAMAHIKALADYFGIVGNGPEPADRLSPQWLSWQKECISNAAKCWWKNKPTPREALALVYYGTQFDQYSAPDPFPNDPRKSLTPEAIQHNATHFRTQVAKIKGCDEPLDFLDNSSIKALIQRQYDLVPWDKLEPIEGNHDMNVPNQYLQLRFANGQPLNKVKDALDGSLIDHDDPDCSMKDPKLSVLVGYDSGTGKRICFEHGHAWDVTNNPYNFCRFGVQVLGMVDGGYHGCKGWTATGLLFDGGELQEPTTHTKEWVINPRVDAALESATETRAFRMFQKNRKHLRLVIMGHTHGPKIEDYTRTFLVAESAQPLSGDGSVKAPQIGSPMLPPAPFGGGASGNW